MSLNGSEYMVSNGLELDQQSEEAFFEDFDDEFDEDFEEESAEEIAEVEARHKGDFLTQSEPECFDELVGFE